MTDVFCYQIDSIKYPKKPFHPDKFYPECCKLPYEQEIDDNNEIYGAVREVLRQLGFDREHFGTEDWNPFKDFVCEGKKVLIKPNLVFHEHPYGIENVKSMVTNASVIRPLIDYVLLAANGNCEIIIGDCPVQAADFDSVCQISGMTDLVSFYREKNIHIQLLDMRKIISKKNKDGVLIESKPNSNRTNDDYICVDLKEKSELMEVIDKADRLEITDYRYGDVAKHHSSQKNEYIIPKEVLEADFIINVPKLKTHRKAGITCAMKNLVGINGDKTCIAHHTRGYKENGGDEFSEKKIKKIITVRVWNWLKSSRLGTQCAVAIKKVFRRTVWHGKTMKEYNMEHLPTHFSEGNWYGNDTIWRCVKDLNKIIFYADHSGKMKDTKQRNYLCIVDAVLAGEGEGPMEQSTKEFGVIFGGCNPVYVDYCASTLMQFDYRDIPIIANGIQNKWWKLVDHPLENATIQNNKEKDISMHFVPAAGWRQKL